jgi:S-adenosylmethionine decarboxylase
VQDLEAKEMKDLCPEILRKRLIVEAQYTKRFEAGDLINFAVEFSKYIGMRIVFGPMTRREGEKISEKHTGTELFTIWAESSMVLYTWEKFNFVTMDIYTCKDFSIEKAVEFIREYFGATDITYNDVYYDRD